MLCYTSENRSGYKRAGLSTNNQIFTLGRFSTELLLLPSILRDFAVQIDEQISTSPGMVVPRHFPEYVRAWNHQH